MIRLLCFVLAFLAASIKSKMKLEAENVVLRHQLTVLRRRLQARVRLTNNDRRYLIVVYRWFPSILQALLSAGLILDQNDRFQFASRRVPILWI